RFSFFFSFLFLLRSLFFRFCFLLLFGLSLFLNPLFFGQGIFLLVQVNFTYYRYARSFFYARLYDILILSTLNILNQNFLLLFLSRFFNLWLISFKAHRFAFSRRYPCQF